MDIDTCEKLISEMKRVFKEDNRESPSNDNNARRGQFKAGWKRPTISESKLEEELTWQNLGYRLKKKLGDKNDDEINEIFESFVNHYHSKRNIDFELTVAQERAEEEGYFDPKDIKDARERINATIARRQGQPVFRQTLLKAYNSRCVITDCDAKEALEAAHIVPYKGTYTNHPSNGLLLRADIHTLYDRYLLSIDPETNTVHVAPNLANTCYAELAGKSITLPQELTLEPNREALEEHYKEFIAKQKS